MFMTKLYYSPTLEINPAPIMHKDREENKKNVIKNHPFIFTSFMSKKKTVGNPGKSPA
jgi:hypothetical protein